MKKLTTLLIAMLTIMPTLAEPVRLMISNVSSAEGQLVVRVYDNEDNWMSEKKDEITKEQHYPLDALENNAITISVDLDKGNYSLFIFHDLDGNNEMKTNWIGIPREPVGTSNNAKGNMGPPAFEDANFEVKLASTELSIKLADL